VVDRTVLTLPPVYPGFRSIKPRDKIHPFYAIVLMTIVVGWLLTIGLGVSSCVQNRQHVSKGTQETPGISSR
jgi:hypothetical protein